METNAEQCPEFDESWAEQYRLLTVLVSMLRNTEALCFSTRDDENSYGGYAVADVSKLQKLADYSHFVHCNQVVYRLDMFAKWGPWFLPLYSMFQGASVGGLKNAFTSARDFDLETNWKEYAEQKYQGNKRNANRNGLVIVHDLRYSTTTRVCTICGRTEQQCPGDEFSMNMDNLANDRIPCWLT